MNQVFRYTFSLVFLICLSCFFVHAQITIVGDSIACKGSPFKLHVDVPSAINTTKYSFATQSSFSWLTPTTPITTTNWGDDSIKGPFNIGFTFSFMCGDYTQFYIGSNGWISFGIRNDEAYGYDISWHPSAIPNKSVEAPKNAIMGPWEDWDPRYGGQITYGITGTAPNRKLVVSWIGIPMHYCPALIGTSQIVIEETTNIISNNILSKPGGCNSTGVLATQGMQNISGTSAYVIPGRNGSLWSTTYESIKYTPALDTNYIEWQALTFNSAGNGTIKKYFGADIITFPDTVTDYYAFVHKCNGDIVNTKIRVSVIQGMTASIVSKDTTICKGQQVLLRANMSGGKTQGYQYIWDTDTTSTGIHAVHPDSSHQYKIKLTDNCTAPDSGYVNVTVKPPLKIKTFTDSTICFGRSLRIAPQISGGNDSTRYLSWGNIVASNQTFLLKQDTLIQLTLNDHCTTKPDSAAINIKVRAPLKINTINDTTLCFGDTLKLKTITIGGDSLHYLYTWNNGIGNVANKKFVPDSSHVYKVVLSDGCTPANDSAQAYVRVRRTPILKIRTDSLICKGQPILLFAQTLGNDTDGISFLWNQNIGYNNYIKIKPDTTTRYSLQFNDRCLATPLNDSVLISVRVPLKLQVSDTLICYGNTINVTAHASGGNSPTYQFTWNTGDTGSVLFGIKPKIKTNYKVVLKDNCTIQNDSQQITVDVRSPLKIILPNDTTLCKRNSLILKGIPSGGLGTYTYKWNDSLSLLNSLTFISNKDTTIILQLNDGCSSPAFDSIKVTTENSPKVNFTYSDLYNCGKAIFSFNQQSEYVKGSSFKWMFDDGSIIYDSNTIYTFIKQGLHQVNLLVRSKNGCVDSTNKSIDVIFKKGVVANFTQSADEVDVLHPKVSFTSLSSDTLKHNWIFGNSGITSSSMFPVITFTDTGSYLISLIVKSVSGCLDTMTKWLKVDDIYTLFVPNSFTPNNDGLNDVFRPISRGVKDFKMYIIERGGNIIFETDDIKNGWNGRLPSNDEWPSQDVFVYKIVATDIKNESHEYTGTATLLR